MADIGDTSPEDRFLLAGEHVLGVLEGQDAADAQRLLLSDPDFAEAVAWWEWRLGPMCEAAGAVTPPEEVWRAIEARIRAENDNERSAVSPARSPAPAPAKVSGLSLAALLTGAGLAVASLVLFLATPQPTQPVPDAGPTVSSPQLVAQIVDEDAGRRIASIIDPSEARLSLKIDGLDAQAGQVPELWVIPAGGAPVSLGAIPREGAFERELTGSEAALLVEGSTLAVTFEDDTGVPHQAPTPPILLAGQLDQI